MPCFHVRYLRSIHHIISVIAIARNIIALSASIPTFIGANKLTTPKNRTSSMIRLPSKSPSPMLACALYSDFTSMAMSGMVVPIPMTVRATK